MNHSVVLAYRVVLISVISHSVIKTEIDVTEVERIRQVQDAIKSELCNNLALVDSPQLLLYSNSNKDKLINIWDLINSFPQEYFIEGGSCVLLRLHFPNRPLMCGSSIWMKIQFVLYLLMTKCSLMTWSSRSSLLNSPLSSASPGSIRISLNSTVIPSNKAISDLIDHISYETPFLVTL